MILLSRTGTKHEQRSLHAFRGIMEVMMGVECILLFADKSEYHLMSSNYRAGLGPEETIAEESNVSIQIVATAQVAELANDGV
jgi:hypothetical protein